MPKKPVAPILDPILQARRVNVSIHVKLVRQIPAKGFDAVPLASRGRTAQKQLVHMHKVHVGWLRHDGVALSGAARAFSRDASPGRRELVTASHASGLAVEKFVLENLAAAERVEFFQGKPVRFLCDRGPIALALEQAGLKLPEKAAINDLSYSWYGGDPP